jgi:hypothetical protein
LQRPGDQEVVYELFKPMPFPSMENTTMVVRADEAFAGIPEKKWPPGFF